MCLWFRFTLIRQTCSADSAEPEELCNHGPYGGHLQKQSTGGREEQVRFLQGQVQKRTKKIDCLREMRGRYVTIVKEPPEALAFCEVEAFGYIFRGKIITAHFRFNFKSNLNCVVSVNSLPPTKGADCSFFP